MLQSWSIRLAGAAVLIGALSTALLSTRSNAELPGARVREVVIEPVLSIAYSGMGGIVAEVCAHAGDRVKKGQVLLRFDASEARRRLKTLEFAERSMVAEMAGRGVLERVPDRVKRYLYQTHPDVVDAEEEYVRALEGWERAPESRRAAGKARLAAAAENRTSARRRLDRVLAASGGREELALVLDTIRKNRAEVEQLLRAREVRAQEDGWVDILDLKAGDRMLPRMPAASIRVSEEYAASLIVSEGAAAKLQPGTRVAGSLEHCPSMAAVVDSVSRRKVPAAFRENRNVEEDTVVRLRFHSSVVPGSRGRFYLP